MLPKATVPPINRAMGYCIETQARKNLRHRLKEPVLACAGTDLHVAAEWCLLPAPRGRYRDGVALERENCVSCRAERRFGPT